MYIPSLVTTAQFLKELLSGNASVHKGTDRLTWPLTQTHKSPFLWRITLGVIMESLTEILEGCEKLWATFKFLFNFFNKFLWPWPLTFWPINHPTYEGPPWESLCKVWLKSVKAVKSYGQLWSFTTDGRTSAPNTKSPFLFEAGDKNVLY